MKNVMKRVVSLLLAVVLMVGMVVPASASEAITEDNTTEIVVESVQEPEPDEPEDEQTPPATESPAPETVVITAAPEASSTVAEDSAPSEGEGEENSVPDETATETPVTETAPVASTPTVEEASSPAEDMVDPETGEFDQVKVDEFIGLYLVPAGVVYPIEVEAYEEAGEEVPSVYFEVTEENYKQVLEAEDSWAELTTAEQEAVDVVICAAYISFLIDEATEAALAEGIDLTDEELEAIRDTEDTPTFKEMISAAHAVKAEVIARTAVEIAEEGKNVEENIEYSDMTAEEFIGLYLTAENGTVFNEVREDTYEQILLGEEDWSVLAPEQKVFVNNALTSAVLSDTDDGALEDSEPIDFASLLVGAKYFADNAEELALAENLSLEDNLYAGILVNADADYIPADVFFFEDAGEMASMPISFTSNSISLMGDSNFGFDTDSSTILDNEKFQDQDGELVIDPHYGSIHLAGTKVYIDWYDNAGDYWGMNARYVENIYGRDQYGNEYQIFCMSPCRKFYDSNTNKAPGYDWNYTLSEDQKRAIALTCLYGTNGNEYLQAAAQTIIFELSTKYRSPTTFARWYKGWHTIVNGMTLWEDHIEQYYYDLPYQLYFHGCSPSWMFDTHDDAIAATYDLTENASTGNYEITLSNTDSKINGEDARKKEWVNRFEYTAYADKDYTTVIEGITFTSTQNTSSSTKATLSVSVPEDIYNEYGEIYVKVKTPSLKTSAADFRLWIPNSSSTTAGQTFIELVSGEGEPAYAYMTLRAGGNSNEFDLTVEKVAAQLAAPYTDGDVTYVNLYGGDPDPMTGVTFGLYNVVDDNADGTPDKAADGSYLLGELISQQEVDADGLATWTALNSELKYVLVEESAPLQYSISKWENGQYLVDNTTNKQTAVTVTAENQVRYYTFSIEKKDLGTDAALSGVTFGLYAEEDVSWVDSFYGTTHNIAADTLIGTFTTGVDSDAEGYMMETRTVNGVTTVTVLIPAGTYYIQEISAPNGYEIDSTKYTVIDFTGDEVTANILNEDDNTTMCSQFQTLELYNKHTFDITVIKFSTSFGAITTNTTTGATFSNPSNAYSTGVAYEANVTFGLYESVDDNGDGAADTNADGSYVLGTLIGKQAVDSSGKVNWTGLDDSKVYVLKELEANILYSAFEFDLVYYYDNDVETYEAGANGHGEILIDNRTYRDSSIGVEINDWIRPLTFSIEKKGANTGEYLAGATFGIYTAETVSWRGYVSGSVRTYTMPEDTLVGTFTTPDSATSSAVTSSSPMISAQTTDGVTTVTMAAPLGSYYVKEISAPPGYELDETEYLVVDFTGDETTTDIVDHTGYINGWTGIGISNAGALSTQNGPLTIINKVPDKEYFDLVVNKYGNGITGISGYGTDGATSGYISDYSTPLSDLTSIAALFRLYEAVDADGDGVADLDADGYYELGTLVSEQWTDNEAKLYWYGLDKEKQYVLHEVAAPNNYNKPNFLGNRILVTPNNSTVTYEVDANDGSSYMYLSIRKLDEETNKPIQGAVFGLYMGEDMYVPGSTTSIAVPKDTLLQTGTTDADGYIWGMSDRAILPGYQYYIKEISVPDGWELDSTPYYLEVYEDHVTYDMMVNTGTNTWDHWTTTYFNNSNSYYFYNDPSDPVYYPVTISKYAEVAESITDNGNDGVDFNYSATHVNHWTINTDIENKAEFAVYAAEDIYDPQGDLAYSAGDRVKVYYAALNEDPARGDLDNDGSVTQADVDYLREIIQKKVLTDDILRRGDLTGDGNINMLDALHLTQYVSGTRKYLTIIKEADSVYLSWPNHAPFYVQNPGTYIVKEVTAPEGWLIDSTEVSVTVTEDATSVQRNQILNNGLGPNASTFAITQGGPDAHFTDAREQLGFKVYKVDAETNQPLSGAVFGLYAATDFVYVETITQVQNKDQEPSFTPNTTTTLVKAGDLIATATSGSDGYAVFDVDVPTNDPDMSFYIMEISAPANYNKSYESWGPYSVKELLGETVNDGISTVAYANNTHTYTVTYENTYAGYGNIYIEKTGDELVGVSVDADGNTQFKYTQTFLEGAEFSVYAAETIYGRDGSVEYNEGDTVRAGLTTNEDGVIFVEHLPFGKYMVKEETAPYGFVTVLSTEYSGYVPGVDLINSGDAAEDDDESLDSDTIVDEDPTESREEAIEAAKFSAEKEVVLDGSVTLGDYDVAFWDPRQIAKVSVTKLEEGTDTPLTGAVFGLYAEDDIYSATGEILVAAGELIAKATSGTGGIATFNVDLPVDHKYCVRELEAPEGYELTDEEFIFEFTYSTQEEAVQEFSYIFYDEPESGLLIIHKVGVAPISAVPNDFYDDEAGWTITAEESPLAGAVYDIYAASSIRNPATGKIAYANGATVKTNVRTDETGKAVVEGLYSGKYRIVEKTAPTGYVISETEKTVTFNSSDASTGTVTFTDERRRMDVVIYKVDGVYDTPLAGAKFALMTGGRDVPIGDTVIPADTIIETAVSGADGYVNFTMDEYLPLGYSYKVVELEAPDMYVKDDAAFMFQYTNTVGGGTQDSVIKVEHTFENDHSDDWEEPGSITVKKVDTDGNPLAGVKFLLEYSTDGQVWTPVYYSEEPRRGVYPAGGTTTPVDAGVATTDETGIVKFSDLKALEDGTILYRLKEIETLNGYQLKEGYVYEGTLPAVDATKPGGFNYDIEFEVVNEWALGSLSIQKVNTIGQKLAETTYLLEYSLDDGTTWAPVFTADPDVDQIEAGSTTAAVTNGMLTTTATVNPVVFTDLLCDGKTMYRLTEVQAPNGHNLLNEPIFTGYLPVIESNGDKTFDLAYIAINSESFKLPKTGSTGFVLPALASGIGLMGIAGLWFVKRRREEDCES